MQSRFSAASWSVFLLLQLLPTLVWAASVNEVLSGSASWTLSKLTEKRLGRLQRLLAKPKFSFLGPWRFNATLLREVNAQLVNSTAGGTAAFIDGFFEDEVAAAVMTDTLRALEAGWARALGSKLKASGLDQKAYQQASSPSARCALLEGLERKIGFKFQFHVLDPRGHATPKASAFPGHTAVLLGMRSKDWEQALLLLATGSSRLQGRAVQFEQPYFREFQSGDYALLHNDLGSRSSGKARALCLNYWLATDGWMPDWGGSFLWCGSHGEARRSAPKFNQANLFVPSSHSWHAVEVVEKPAESISEHRFSFTSWLNVHESTQIEHGDGLHRQVSRAHGSDL